MKLGQLMKYTKINIFFKNYAESKARRLVPDLFLYFKKIYYQVKASGIQLVSIYFNSFQLGTKEKHTV